MDAVLGGMGKFARVYMHKITHDIPKAPNTFEEYWKHLHLRKDLHKLREDNFTSDRPKRRSLRAKRATAVSKSHPRAFGPFKFFGMISYYRNLFPPFLL